MKQQTRRLIDTVTTLASFLISLAVTNPEQGPAPLAGRLLVAYIGLVLIFKTHRLIRNVPEE